MEKCSARLQSIEQTRQLLRYNSVKAVCGEIAYGLSQFLSMDTGRVSIGNVQRGPMNVKSALKLLSRPVTFKIMKVVTLERNLMHTCHTGQPLLVPPIVKDTQIHTGEKALYVPAVWDILPVFQVP